MADKAYRGRAYQLAMVTLRGLPCWQCGLPSDTVDHVPPLSSMPEGHWSGMLRPCCGRCNYADGARIRNGRPLNCPPSRKW